MDLQTIVLLFVCIVVLIFLVIYYFLRKIDLKNKDKYPERFDGTFLDIMFLEMENIFVKDIGFGKLKSENF